MKRAADSPELLDGELDPEVLAGNLRDLSRVNRWLSGTQLSLAAVLPIVAGLPGASVLDVGTGAADIPARLAKSQLKVTATDVRPEIVELARQRVSGSAVVVRVGRLEDERDAVYDVVHSSMVVHHLDPADAVSFLREARRVARLAVVINDLNRGWRWLIGAWLLTRVTTRNAYTRHDAPLSVRRAYTPEEMVDLARKAGLRPVARYASRPAFRYALVFVADRD